MIILGAEKNERKGEIMDYQLEGKRALVTGSTKGIGFSTAVLLAKEGASVCINGRTPDSVFAASERLRSQVADADVRGIAADLSAAEGIEVLTEGLGEVDILVNNLGIFQPTPFQDIADADWQRFFDVNVMSGIRLSRRYLPGMMERNWGRIVFVSSESGVQIPEEMIHYGMTKAAQIAVARGLAETTKGGGVTVNSALPGPTRSEGVETFVKELAAEKGMTFEEMEKEFFRSARPTSLLQRFTETVEVAHLIAYLCSPLSSATNGAALRVDGGVVRSMV